MNKQSWCMINLENSPKLLLVSNKVLYNILIKKYTQFLIKIWLRVFWEWFKSKTNR